MKNKITLNLEKLLNITIFLVSSFSKGFLQIILQAKPDSSFSRGFFFTRKRLKGMDSMTLALVVTLIVFFMSVFVVLSVLGTFGPEAQTSITRLTFGLGESVPSFG